MRARTTRLVQPAQSVLASVASLPGLLWVEETGINTVAAHNRALGEQIIDWAKGRGLRLASPETAARRGGSIMLLLPEAVTPSELVGQLRERKLYSDARGSTLRLSPGVVSQSEDIAALCAALGELIPA